MTNLLQGGSPTLLVAIRIAKVLDVRVEDIWIEDTKRIICVSLKNLTF